MESLFKLLRRFSSTSLCLVILCLVSISMIVACLAVGADPRAKIYILAEKETVQYYSNLISQRVSPEVLVYSPEIEENELDVLVRTNTIKTIVIADYMASFPRGEKLIRIVISRIDTIIVLDKYQENHFALEVLSALRGRVIIMSDEELLLEVRKIYDECHGDYKIFTMGAGLVAFLSLFLVGITAVISIRLAIRSGSSGIILGVLGGCVIGVVFFTFVQQIFLSCSSMLEMPLSLHSTNSSITATSYIGPFRGGTIPRFLFGIGGSLIGISKMKYIKRRRMFFLFLYSILSLSFLIFALFTFGHRNFLGGFFLTSIYRIAEFLPSVELESTSFSRGVIVLFFGLISSALLPNLQKETKLFLLPLSIISVSWGLMRVGDLRPEVASYSFYLGIAFGIFTALSIVCFDETLLYVKKLLPEVSLRLRSWLNKEEYKTKHQ